MSYPPSRPGHFRHRHRGTHEEQPPAAVVVGQAARDQEQGGQAERDAVEDPGLPGGVRVQVGGDLGEHGHRLDVVHQHQQRRDARGQQGELQPLRRCGRGTTRCVRRGRFRRLQEDPICPACSAWRLLPRMSSVNELTWLFHTVAGVGSVNELIREYDRTHGARQGLPGTGLLAGPCARARRRALDDAGAAGRVLRRTPVQRLRRPPRHPACRPHRTPAGPGRRRRPCPAALPGVPAARRVRPHRGGPGPVARAVRVVPLG